MTLTDLERWDARDPFFRQIHSYHLADNGQIEMVTHVGEGLVWKGQNVTCLKGEDPNAPKILVTL